MAYLLLFEKIVLLLCKLCEFRLQKTKIIECNLKDIRNCNYWRRNLNESFVLPSSTILFFIVILIVVVVLSIRGVSVVAIRVVVSVVALVSVVKVSISIMGSLVATRRSFARSARRVGQLDEVLVHLLLGLLQHIDQLLHLASILLSHEGVGRATLAVTAGAANAMDIVLRVLRVIVIDDILYIAHIYERQQQLVSKYSQI